MTNTAFSWHCCRLWTSRVFGVCVLFVLFGIVHAGAQQSQGKKEPKADATAAASPSKDANQVGVEPAQKETVEPVNLMDLPIAVGGAAKQIKIPYYDIEGNLKMRFEAEVAKRSEEKTMELDVLKVEIFDEQGAPDLQIEMPESKLNLETHELVSEEDVKISRKDFTISGEGMTFDSKTKKGTIQGRVKMVIFNVEAIK